MCILVLFVQVHGGIREEDIVQFLQKVQTHAETNREQKLDTLVFFDEANTTDSVGLIKEIMCDRRLHGNPIPADIKFIAACNPYRRLCSNTIYIYTYMHNYTQ